MRTFLQHQSLGRRIQALVGLAFVAGLAVFLSFQTYARINVTVAERRDANMRIVLGLAGPASGALKEKEDSVLFSYMEVLESDPTAAAVIIAADHKVLQSQQSIKYRGLPLKKLKALVLSAETTGKVETLEVDDYQFVATPIRDSGGRVMGSFAAAWNIKGIYGDVLRNALFEALALISIVAFVLLLLVRSMNKHVIRPLVVLASQIDGSQSNVDISIYENRADEVGSFARALGKFRQLHGQFDAALANMSQGICMFDHAQRLVIFNERYREIYSIPPGALKFGLPLSEVMKILVRHNSDDGSIDRRYVSEHVAKAELRKSAATTHAFSSGRTVVTSFQPTEDGGWVETHSDITDLRRIEAQVTFQAEHDSLTSLPNRMNLSNRLDQFLVKQPPDKAVAIFYIDLDGFKTVNDTMGHATGDILLKAVADRLVQFADDEDFVGRLGGDEFAIIKFGVRDPAELEQISLRVCEEIAKPFDLENRHVLIGASIGTAIGPADGNSADQLLKNADLALYEAKKSGKNTWRLYDKTLSARLLERRELELELRTALREEQFELHYQPLVDLKSNHVTGFEALMRWRHPERGMIPPAQFIPVAEEIGLIVPLGEWALRTACLEAAKWPADTRVAVNISPVQFQGCDLPQLVFSALAASHLAANRLELEVTESVLLQENSATLDTLHKLRNFGVRIAIDDFGTGYSALGYLRKFPFDKIKIDRSFVGDLTAENEQSIIINAIVGISRSLSIATVAEGVETELQRGLVMVAGVTEMQGYLFSRPLSADAVARTYFPHLVSKQQSLLQAG